MLRSPATYPDTYCWYILAGVLDIALTWVVLSLGGSEVNIIAQRAIELGGHWGLILLKLSSVVLVIFICEHITRRQPRVARRLAVAAVAISAFPPVMASAQLALYAAGAFDLH